MLVLWWFMAFAPTKLKWLKCSSLHHLALGRPAQALGLQGILSFDVVDVDFFSRADFWTRWKLSSLGLAQLAELAELAAQLFREVSQFMTCYMHAAVFFALINVAVRSVTFKINHVFLSGSMRNIVMVKNEWIWKEDMDITCPMASHGILHPMARYKLLYTFRAHLSDDNSYNCVYQKQDGAGNSWDLSCRPQPLMDIDGLIQKPSRLSSLSSRPEVVLLCQRTARIVGDVALGTGWSRFSLSLLRCSSHPNAAFLEPMFRTLWKLQAVLSAKTSFSSLDVGRAGGWGQSFICIGKQQLFILYVIMQNCLWHGNQFGYTN